MRKYYQEGNSRPSDNVLPQKTKYTRNHRHNQSWLIRYCRLLYLRILRLRGKPETLATGLAVGVFAGCFPFFGLQTFIGIFLAAIFRGSKVAAAAGTWISNPLTYLPIYVFNYKVGKFLLRVESLPIYELDLQSFSDFRELGSTFAITLMVGCFVVGIIVALIAYFSSLHFLRRQNTIKYQARKIEPNIDNRRRRK